MICETPRLGQPEHCELGDDYEKQLPLIPRMTILDSGPSQLSSADTSMSPCLPAAQHKLQWEASASF